MTVEATLLLTVVMLPLALAAGVLVPRLKPYIIGAAPAATAPALAACLLLPADTAVALPALLLGLELRITPLARIFLGVAAVLWMAAAVFVRPYLWHDPLRGRFIATFLMAMAGNLGLLIAGDLAGFYVFFALMSLTSYVLVVHDQTEKAYRAGLVYIVLAVIGETCLLVGLIMTAGAADSLSLNLAPAALAEAPNRTVIVALLATGFGIKMGLVPLHFWLPVAHPAAPTPASGVLSGSMIKAGLFGMMSVLPLGGAAMTGWGWYFTIIGLFTAFYGVACGLGQRDPKAILAYSSVSQMGLLATALGVGFSAPAAWESISVAVAMYVIHHGFAKTGLFLYVGVVQSGAATGLSRRVLTIVVAVGALALAGLPFTSGAYAKLALKAAVAGAPLGVAGQIETLLALSGAATTILVVHFLRRMATLEPKAKSPDSAHRFALLVPVLALLIGGQILLWLIGSPTFAPGILSGYALWNTTWPVALGAGLAFGGVALSRARGRRYPSIPQGDILIGVEGLAHMARRPYDRSAVIVGTISDQGRLHGPLYRAVVHRFSRLEAAMARPAGLAVIMILSAILLVLAMDRAGAQTIQVHTQACHSASIWAG